MSITTWVIIGVVVALALILCFALAVANFSFENYSEKLKKVDQIRNSANLNTLEYVEELNQNHFGGNLRIVRCPEWEDFYSSGKIGLSSKTMASNSLASLAIVSHELGHARQDASGNTLTKQFKMRRQGRLCGFFFMPLVVVGAVLCLLWVFGILPEMYAIIAGGACLALAALIFVFAIIIKFREVKVEKEASEFAVEFLRDYLSENEVKICKDFLDSAKLTYWATLIRTMLSWTFLTKKETMFR